jgi:hypothetical protein
MHAMSDHAPTDRNDPDHPVVRDLARAARDVLREAVAAGIADPADIEGFDDLDALDTQHADRADARRAGERPHAP